jgi:hypothetical protein
MSCWKSVVLAITLVAIAAGGQGVKASDDKDKDAQVVFVQFGAGFNQPGALNHHILPPVIKVRTKLATDTTPAIPGVVSFTVAGLHQIFVYQQGVTPDDIKAFLAANDPTNAKLFINDLNNTFYQGFNPVRLVNGVPTYNDNVPATTPPAPRVDRNDTMNRVESVGFTMPGMYLVICNVRPHFQGGMMAWVKVVADDDDDNDDHGHDHQ